MGQILEFMKDGKTPRCTEMVSEPSSGYRQHQCTRAAKIGLRCKQHDPETAQARQDASFAKWNKETAALQRPHKMLAAFKKALEHIAGDNPNAHGVSLYAAQVLKEWETK